MPLYEYQCEACGCRFELRQAADKAGQSACPSCEEQAEQMVPDTFNSTYKPQPDGTMRPQNTGVSNYDANVDRVIGDHSSKGWQKIHTRYSRKRGLLRDNPSKTGHDLGRTVDNDYKILKTEERQAAETARNLHTEAIHRIDRWKKSKKDGTAGS
jgi:putative FmdB family regulatory protein